MPDTVEVARRYTAKLWIEECDKDDPERQNYDRQVVSIEENVDYTEDLPSTHYLTLPYAEASKFFAYTTNDGQDVWPDEEGLTTVCLPIQVKDVMYTVSGGQIGIS